MTKAKPKAVLISDIHFNVNTNDIASSALALAIDKANDLKVPLIVAGDLTDTKSHLNSRCVDSMIMLFQLCKIRAIILRGNHDSVNERSEFSALGFLGDKVRLIESNASHMYSHNDFPGLFFFPYHSFPDQLRRGLKEIPKGSTIIMHQGVTRANSGDYIQDKSAINPEDLASFRVISGHYHTRQSFALPDGGRFDYIGNPYTLTFGEANDPPKGFQVLYDDGNLEFVPTNLRRHIIIEMPQLQHYLVPEWTKEDLLWVKVKGSSDELVNVTKKSIASSLNIQQDFRLDLMPNETKSTLIQENVKNQSSAEIFDSLIDSLTNTDDDRKIRLKDLWKGLV